METIYIKKSADLKENLKLLKQKLNVEIKLEGNKVIMEGSAVEEYTASRVFEAIQFGFTVQQALQLTDPDMHFVKVNIKQATRRKNMEEVRSRVIGKEGKTKRTLENISGCEIVVNDNNEAGLIGPAESIDAATVGLKNVVKGSKQSNVYAYMERMNTERKKHKTEDLGLKEEEKGVPKKEKSQKEMDEDEEDFDDDDDEE